MKHFQNKLSVIYKTKTSGKVRILLPWIDRIKSLVTIRFMHGNKDLRKTVMVLLLICTAIIAIIVVLRYLDTGTITITTNVSNATITLVQSSANIDNDDGTSSVIKIFTGHGRLSKRVMLGRYTATVQDGSAGTMQVINLISPKNLSYKLDLAKYNDNVEAINYQNTNTTSATNQQSFVFLNEYNGHLYQIDSSNQLSAIAPNYIFESVQWINNSLGVGETTDGKFCVITDLIVTPLNISFLQKSSGIKTYSVAPDGTLYIADGNSIYKGNLQGKFKKLYTVNNTTFSIVASPNGILIDESAGTGLMIIEINIHTGKFTKENYRLGQAAWSPDGRYLASTIEGSSFLYDTRLNNSSIIPKPSPAAFIGNCLWLNDRTLIYNAGGDETWIYNITTQRAKLLYRFLPGAETYSLHYDGGSYIYQIMSRVNGTASIQRIGLN